MRRTISEQVRDIIRDRGVSGYELAQAARLNRSVVNRFIAGGSMTLESLDRLAEVLKLRVVEDARRLPKRAAKKPDSPAESDSGA